MTQQRKSIQKHPFNSNAARIIGTHAPSDSPGPGAYNHIISSNNLKNSANRKKKRNNLKSQFNWMVNDHRSEALKMYQNNKYVGPNSYEIKSSSKSPKYTWGKSLRFDNKPQKGQQMGPGYYNYEQKIEASGASAVFKSQVPKSIDNYPNEAFISVEQNFQNAMSSNSSLKETKPLKNQKYSVFASKVPRFLQKSQPMQSNLGPGYYTIQKDEFKLKTGTLPCLQMQTINSPRKQTMQVGPGSYQINKYSLVNTISKKGYALSKETRFNFRTKKATSTILPGPGQYMEKKYLYADKSQLFNNQVHQRKHNSLYQPSKHEARSDHSSPGFYDLKMFDISYGVERKLEYIQNLKTLKVEIAPFNSKANRLV